MLSGGTFPVLSKQKKGIYMSEKYKDTGLRPEERAKSLLEEMGLEEKMGQVNCVFPFDRVCFDYDYISEQTKYGIGEVSTLEMRRMETLEEAAAWQRKVQEIVMANSEHHIPAIFHMEGLCGAFIQDATSFPSGIGRASSFDTGLEEKIAEMLQGTVAILGGGAVGLETAAFLAQRLPEGAAEFGIKIIEQKEKMGMDMGAMARPLLNELKKKNVSFLTTTTATLMDGSKLYVKIGEMTLFVSADTVIWAGGGEPVVDTELTMWLMDERMSYAVVGDANEIGDGGTAIKDAYELYTHLYLA